MPGGKKKGRGNGSQKENRFEYNKEFKKKDLFDSLVSVSSLVKTRSTRNPEKLPAVSEDPKQATVYYL